MEAHRILERLTDSRYFLGRGLLEEALHIVRKVDPDTLEPDPGLIIEALCLLGQGLYRLKIMSILKFRLEKKSAPPRKTYSSRSRNRSRSPRKDNNGSRRKQLSGLPPLHPRNDSPSSSKDATPPPPPQTLPPPLHTLQAPALTLKQMAEMYLQENPDYLNEVVAAYQRQKEWKKLIFLGDSLLVRLQKLKSFKNKFNEYVTASLSVPGSSIKNALWTLQSKMSTDVKSFGNSIMVILLGTNDFLKYKKFNHKDFDIIVKTAIAVSSKLLIIKIPPIPLMPELNYRIFHANEYLTSLERTGKIHILNPVEFKDPKAGVSFDLFEQTYFSGKRDLVHLNAKGLNMLAESILQDLDLDKKTTLVKDTKTPLRDPRRQNK